MNMMTTSKHIDTMLDKLIEIDPRFKGWTDYRPSLVDAAKGGRYIEVYQCPSCRLVFIAGDNKKELEENGLWIVGEKSGYKEGEVKLLGIFDKVEKREVTSSLST